MLVVIVFVAAVLAVVLYLLLAFYAGVMHTVMRLREASERMLDNHEDKAVTLDMHDKLGEVVLAFNRVRTECAPRRCKLKLKAGAPVQQKKRFVRASRNWFARVRSLRRRCAPRQHSSPP